MVPPLPAAPSYQSASRQSAPTAAASEDRAGAQSRPKASYAVEPQSLTWAAKRGWLLAAIVGTLLIPPCGGQVGAGGAWLFALLGFVLGYVLFKKVTDPPDTVTNLGLKVFAFTATVGIISVLLFQGLAAAINEADVQRVGGSAKWTVSLWIVRIVGYAYNTALGDSPDEGFVVSLIAMLISVGLCEETVKLVPVAWLLGNKRIDTANEAFFIAAMSGLGFGIAESLHYAFSSYIPSGCACISILDAIHRSGVQPRCLHDAGDVCSVYQSAEPSGVEIEEWLLGTSCFDRVLRIRIGCAARLL